MTPGSISTLPATLFGKRHAFPPDRSRWRWPRAYRSIRSSSSPRTAAIPAGRREPFEVTRTRDRADDFAQRRREWTSELENVRAHGWFQWFDFDPFSQETQRVKIVSDAPTRAGCRRAHASLCPGCRVREAARRAAQGRTWPSSLRSSASERDGERQVARGWFSRLSAYIAATLPLVAAGRARRGMPLALIVIQLPRRDRCRHHADRRANTSIISAF